MQQFQEAITSLEKATQPVIAAIHGIAFGLAIDIACACDVRLVSENTKLSIMVRVCLTRASGHGRYADIDSRRSRSALLLTSAPCSASPRLWATVRLLVSWLLPVVSLVLRRLRRLVSSAMWSRVAVRRSSVSLMQWAIANVADSALELAKVIAANSPIAVTSTKHIITRTSFVM